MSRGRRPKYEPLDVLEIVEYIGPEFTVGQLAGKLDVSKPTARRYLRQIHNDGLALILTYPHGKYKATDSEEDIPYVALSTKMIAKWITTLEQFGDALRQTKTLPAVKQAFSELPNEEREQLVHDTMKIKHLVDMALVESEYDRVSQL